MQIRQVEVKDKEQLVKLIVAFDKQSQRYLTKEQIEFRQYTNLEKAKVEEVEEYFSSGFAIFVADDGGRLVGLVVGNIKEKKNRVNNKEGFVEKWYVDSAYQGKHVGTKLFARLEGYFKESGCTHLALDTHIKNEEAIRIYDHMGFTKRLVTFYKVLED